MIVDSHCHPDSADFNDDREAVVDRALVAGVGTIVAIGTGNGPPDLEAGVRMADSHPAFRATVGVHPNDVAKADDSTLGRIASLLKHPKVVFLGEIGLDYHYDFAPPDRQKALFIEQLAIARDAAIPVVIHTREAWDDTLAILRDHWVPHGLPCIMHCFSGGMAEARACLELGFYLSFGGIVTFPKAIEIQQAARETPLNRLLVETDAPYLAPVPKRGKRNEPAFVVHTLNKLAELRGTTCEELAAATTSNFVRLCSQRANRYTEEFNVQ